VSSVVLDIVLTFIVSVVLTYSGFCLVFVLTPVCSRLTVCYVGLLVMTLYTADMRISDMPNPVNSVPESTVITRAIR